MSYKSSCKNTWKKILSKVGIFFAEGFTLGRWEFKFTWKF